MYGGVMAAARMYEQRFSVDTLLETKIPIYSMVVYYSIESSTRLQFYKYDSKNYSYNTDIFYRDVHETF